MKSIFNEKIEKETKVNLQHAKIVTIEGIDGSGKTTLIESCVKKLSNIGYRATYFHTSSSFNVFWQIVNESVQKEFLTKDMNQILHNVAFLTYAKTLFIDEVNNHDFVIGDWYIYGKMLLSQLYTNNPNCFSKKIIEEELAKRTLLLPDYSFFLDVFQDVAFERIQKREVLKEEKESLEMLKKAYELWQEYVLCYQMDSLNGNLPVLTLTDIVLSKIMKKGEKNKWEKSQW